MRISGLLITAVVFQIGCFTDVSTPSGGDDETSATETSSSTSSPTGGEEATAPSESGDVVCEGTCVAAVPPWSGPAIPTPPGVGCAPPFSETVVSGDFDISGLPATCDCGCGEEETVVCDMLVLDGGLDGVDCDDGGAEPVGPVCAPLSFQGTALRQVVAVPPAASCVASSTEEAPPVQFDTLELCGASTNAGCAEAERCVPQAPVGLCIFRAGIHPCPPGYPEQAVVFETIDDQRVCSPCECLPDEAECVGGSVRFHPMECDRVAPPPFPVGQCSTVAAMSANVAEEATATALCLPTGGEPRGQVEGADPITICCAADS